MYLVDTSVWIDFLRGSHGKHVDALKSLLHNDRDFEAIASVEPALKLYTQA